MAIITNNGTQISPYPRLRKHRETSTIVLFISKCEGIVLERGRDEECYAGLFGSFWDSKEFEDFYEKFTIETL